MPTDAALTSPPPSNTLFTATVVLSLLAHVVVIGVVKFGPPDPRTLFNRMPIEILLVNAKGKVPPAHPKALAQTDLDGGGNVDTPDMHIKTPLPAQQVDNPSDELSLASQRVTDEEERQRKLLSALKDAPKLDADAAHPTPVKTEVGLDVDAIKRQASEIERKEGEIAQEIQAYQSKPHKAFVGISTKGVAEAHYVDAWRGKIERIGTLNYPLDTAGHRLAGSLQVTVEILADGSLGKVTLDRSSGNPDLDAAAERIVRMAAPFSALPPGILDSSGHRADILSITRRWTFTHAGNQMEFGNN